MKLTIVPLRRAAIDTIAAWRYEPPYDLYNLDYPPTAEAIACFLDPDNAYHEILVEVTQLLVYTLPGSS